ncbi:MAG TPA: ABC transporter permease [Actinomycetota bacterium]|jgi:ABC-2 type transport system permease protein
MKSVGVELLVLRKRASTWILLGVWTLLGLLFSYLLPYLTYRGGIEGPRQSPLETLLPQRLADNLLGGFPFFGGVFALMLGVLAIGSDYGWDTLKTVLIQRPGRMRMFGSKLTALAVGLVPFVIVIFVAGAAASSLIAGAEGAAVHWPSAWELIRAAAAGWFVLATWAAFGVLLAVVSRGTALAIGLGILYALVIEGLLSALASEVGWLDALVEYFLRANAYSLVAAIGVPTAALVDNGPGSFFGPFVGAGQAISVMSAYAICFLALSAILIRRRDVS